MKKNRRKTGREEDEGERMMGKGRMEDGRIRKSEMDIRGKGMEDGRRQKVKRKWRVKGRGIIRGKREGGREKKCEERGGGNREEKRLE